MNRSWTFARKLAAGYAVMVAIALIIAVVAIYALRTTVAGKDHVINTNAQILLEVEKLHTAMEARVSAVRGYIISPEERFLTQLRTSREQFAAIVARLKQIADSDEARRMIDATERASQEYRQVAEQLAALARSQAKTDQIVRQFDEKLLPVRDQLDEQLRALVALEERQLAEAKTAASSAAANAINLMLTLAVAALLFAAVVAFLLTRILGRQIGAAVGHVQSSSAELQAAASQQASGAREQATAMSEISTTISELVAASKQIAESAQRVAQIAEQTAAAARTGDGKVDKGQESMAGMRRQVDIVVNHMLDLGRKSQEIGAVLDIVAELAEQTNILAINATIEATGAGDAGKRFAVVADEIRKLADRVSNSTKEIRAQIDDVRSAVNTTVMATETSAKAVDAGARQFSEVAMAFKQISDLVGTTTDAAREIELSTKQQATAAEQVRIAVTDVSQATKETETSSSQTLQTASQLASLSTELRRLIQPQGS
jgi:methyl-accepting chemotaxis protein